jgi:type IV secretion system protein VirB4
LALGPIALTLCGASSPADQQRIDRVLVAHPREDFAQAYLADAGLDWAADLVGRFVPEGVPS